MATTHENDLRAKLEGQIDYWKGGRRCWQCNISIKSPRLVETLEELISLIDDLDDRLRIANGRLAVVTRERSAAIEMLSRHLL